jgi:hypothetical protein
MIRWFCWNLYCPNYNRAQNCIQTRCGCGNQLHVTPAPGTETEREYLDTVSSTDE